MAVPLVPAVEEYTIEGTGQVIFPGDYVMLQPSGDGQPLDIARVEVFILRGVHVIAVCRLYCRPEPTPALPNETKELYLSEGVVEERNAESIVRRCMVYSLRNYNKLELTTPYDFYCSKQYSTTTGTFATLECYCEMPIDPIRLMFNCCGCGDLFHPECVGMTIEAAEVLLICDECLPFYELPPN